MAVLTPFLIVPMTVVRLAAAWEEDDAEEGGGLGWAPGGAVMGRLRITVAVLPSLDSLVPLARRAVRVAGREIGWVGAGAGWGWWKAAVVVAPRLRRAAAVEVEDAVVVVVVVMVVALVVLEVMVLRAAVAVVGRVVDRPPSTILLRMLVASTARPGVTAGRAMPDLPGVAAVRGTIRELEVVGDRTCAGLRETSAACWARIFF